MATARHTAMIITMTTETGVSAAALYRLMAFLSPAFPVGAYTYSHGLEQVIEDGQVTDAASLRDWLTDILRFGAGRGDAILVAETMQAAGDGDINQVRELIDLALALQPSKERHLETSAQGTAFVSAILKGWAPDADRPAASIFTALTDPESVDTPRVWPYPVAVGLTVAAWDIPPALAVTGFLHAFAANVISVAVRAVPLGQSEGQRVLASLEPVIADLVAVALVGSLDDLGTSSFLADIASMAHETQYSRLFRS